MKLFWRILLPVLTAFFLAFIPYNSLQKPIESQARSTGIVSAVSDGIESVTHQTVTKGKRVRMNRVIRKLAHVAEYAAFTFCLTMTVFAFRSRVGKWGIFIFLFGFGLGGLDEYLQSFVKGRSPAFTDTLLDLAGVVLGLGLAMLIAALITKRRKKHELAVSTA